MEKLVSIIIPVYNAEKYIERCINSVINQTYKKIEVIIINDGSSDGSLRIIQKFANNDNRIKVIDKINEGVSIARNTGIMASTGEYICFIDADDYIDKLMIERLINVIIEQNVDIVRSNYKKITLSGKEIQGDLYNYSNKKLDKMQIEDKLIQDVISGKIPAFVCLLIIKKDKIKNFFIKDINFMEDTVFFLELLLNINSIYFLDEIFYQYELNENGATQSKKNIQKNINSSILVYKKIKEILDKYKIQNKENYSMLNNTMSERILNFIYIMYINNININEIVLNEDILLIFKMCEQEKIKFYNKLTINSIIKQQFLKLKIYFTLRRIITKFIKR